MSSMYKYPTVPRLDPKQIPTPKSMYQVQPIFKTENVASLLEPALPGHSEDGDNNNSDLRLILEKQNSVIKRLTELETCLSCSGFTEVDMIEAQMQSLVLRQDKLMTAIDTLEQRLKNAAINDVLKTAATTLTGDISIFVNWSSLPHKLKSYIKFFKTQGLKILIQIHQHSSIAHLKLENVWSDIHDLEPTLNRVDFNGTISFIVREQSTLEPILVVDPQAIIVGDDNIIKFLDQRFGHLLRNQH